MIRLLQLISTLDRSGAEKQLTLLATHLPRDEFEVHVVALQRGGPYADELAAAGIPVTVLKRRLKFDPLTFLALKRLMRELKPDILQTWMFTANSAGRLAAGAHPKVPILVSERCVDVWKSGWQHWLDRRLAPRTTRLIANSQSTAEFYRKQGFPDDRLVVIPNGIEPPGVSGMSRDEARRGLGIDPAAHVMAYIGRLARQKRVQDLIWAFELIRVMEEEVVFLIAGDGPEREQLERFAGSLNLENRVRFLGHRSDAPALLAASDLFWLASDFEGLSNSVMEAMAAGLPVVVSDIPPNRELVVHGATGYVVPVGDRAAFAQYGQKLLLDRGEAARMGAAGRERIGKEFGISKMVEAYAKLYREVLSGPVRG